jgi:hypothetical protein
MTLAEICISASIRQISPDSRLASPELLTHEPHLLPTWIRIHRVFELISDTNARIAIESGIEWP